jgi:adenylyltransferase/sulfurtransferase
VNRTALIVGTGGLGCTAALTLAASGAIQTLGLADGDRVELSNLHRQLLQTDADLGADKTETAATKLRRLPGCPAIVTHPRRVTRGNVAEILSAYDFVIDATDNPESKFLLNDAAVWLRKPLVYGGVVALEGQLMTILPGQSACLRCLFPEAPGEGEVASCSEAGILGPLAAIVGALQAEEAVKYFDGRGDLLSDRLLTIDGRTLRFREVPVRRSPKCPLCGKISENVVQEVP